MVRCPHCQLILTAAETRQRGDCPICHGALKTSDVDSRADDSSGPRENAQTGSVASDATAAPHSQRNVQRYGVPRRGPRTSPLLWFRSGAVVLMIALWLLAAWFVTGWFRPAAAAPRLIGLLLLTAPILILLWTQDDRHEPAGVERRDAV